LKNDKVIDIASLVYFIFESWCTRWSSYSKINCYFFINFV